MGTLAAIAIGVVGSLIASWIYGIVSQYHTYRSLKRDNIIDSNFHYYWYDSQTIRKTTSPDLRHAIIKIYRNWLGLLSLSQKEVRSSEDNLARYDYKGTVLVTENQLHLRKTGINHREIGYTILDRPLNIGDILYGVTLVTSNDSRKEPIGMRCIMAPTELRDEEAREILQANKFVSPPRRS